MKLLRCRKCGATITTNDEVMRNYMEEIDRLTRLAIKDRKNGATVSIFLSPPVSEDKGL